MKLENSQTDEAILHELAARLTRRRIALELTQAELAQQAGIGKRTLERIEAGGSSQLGSWLRVLRALGLVDGLEQLIPAVHSRPMQLLRAEGKQRQRASSRRRETDEDGRPWTWGDDA